LHTELLHNLFLSHRLVSTCWLQRNTAYSTLLWHFILWKSCRRRWEERETRKWI